MAVQIQFRRGTAVEWANTSTGNPILAEAEMGIETDTSLFKIGDGIKRWNDLPYGGIRGYDGSRGIQGPANMEVQNVLYVSKSGNDANDGRSLNTSKLTVKAALAIATTGTTVFVKSGTYVENNPMIVPAEVAIIGDNLRTVTIRAGNVDQDIFWVYNGSYIAHITVKDHIAPAAAVAFNPDGSAGAITRSPYVQNCTSITTTGTGMRVDGDHVAGTKSMVVDAYTQYNQGGIGIHLLNRGYAQLVSVFTINCDKGFLCESGGFCSITNSNSSFGNYALYADGVSKALQTTYVTTATRRTITLTHLVEKPAIGDALKVSNTTTYYTINTSTSLRIGTNPIVNPTISNESADLRNARQSILNRKTSIQVDTIDYLNDTYPEFLYNQFLCNRDIGTILNCVAYDMVLGSNYQSVTAGLSYSRQGALIVRYQQLDITLAALQYVKAKALSYLTAGTTAYTRYSDNFDIVLDIIENGTTAAPPINYPSPSGVNPNIVSAKDQIQANKEYITAETLQYIVNNYPPSFSYDKTICYRDTGLIVDAISQDLLFGGNSQSTFAGIQYWSQGDYIDQIERELTTTTSAINYVSALAQEIVRNSTTGTRYQSTITQITSATTLVTTATVNLIKNDFKVITDILTTGTANITDRIVPNGIDPSSSASVLQAFELLQANKEYLQTEAIAFIDATATGFNYNQDTCSRDTGLIVDSLAFDILYEGISQSVFAGLQYWTQSGYTGIIGKELTTTTNAINYVKSRLVSIASTLSNAAVVSINANVNKIVSILNSGTTGVTDMIIPNSNPSGDADIISAYENILAKKSMIQDNTVSWIETNNPTFVFDTETCRRDVGYIIDSVAFDLLHGGNRQSIMSGVYYYGYNASDSTISELPQTTAAYNYIKSILPYIITGTSVPIVYQTSVAQNTTSTHGTLAQATLAQDKIDIITNIINNGPSEVTEKTPIDATAIGDADAINTAKIIHANREFIRAEIVAYIDTNYADGIEYDRNKCSRDTGLIVDAVAQDVMFVGISQSNFAGIQYWNQNGYVGAISGELTTTTNAINWLKNVAQQVILNDTGGDRYGVGTQLTGDSGTSAESIILGNNFDIITNILTNGTVGVTDQIIPNGLVVSENLDVQNAYNLLQINKTYLQDEVIAYVEATMEPGFVYDQATCSRDVGYIIDSIAFDLLYGGNRQSIQSGVYYYDYNASSLVIANEIPETVAAYNFIKSLTTDIILGNEVAPHQNKFTQYISNDLASSTEVGTIEYNIDLITNIIANGPTVAPAKIPIGLNASSDTNKINAFQLLIINRDFIRAETIAYINQTFYPFEYNRETCYRDVGYMVDSVSVDLLYGGNKQAIQSGAAYFGYVSTSSVIANEITQTTAAYEYIKSMAHYIILGTSLPITYQENEDQITTLDPGTITESDAIDVSINLIKDIIQYGPVAAPGLTGITPIASTDTNIINAAKLLHANRKFMQAEIIAYIDTTYPNLDQDVCARDINYILNALSYDLLYEGNSQMTVAGAAYYQGTYLTVIEEIVPVLDSYNFMNTLIQTIIQALPCDSLQGDIGQDTTTYLGATQLEADRVNEIFGVLIDILTNGFTSVITVESNIKPIPDPGTRVTIHHFSLIVATSMGFEWIGTGIDINQSLPYLGGEPDSTKLGYEVNGGKVNFTGTDERGDFRIGNDLTINRSNGTISGRTFTKSLFAVMTPYIMSIGG
jgi:hypothetical protein